MDPPENTASRPLSPHLQVYRLAFTTVLSGLHRITGLLLSAASVVLVAWLAAAACGPEPYAAIGSVLASWPVRILLAGTLAVFWYHLFNGIRHLVWDAGFGFDMRAARGSGALVVLFAAVSFGATLALTPAWRWLVGGP
ncbi:MAG TPA: succinate dehydrogenase, cytochrome b556 subunit [Steroidobacteraceae bacterium]|nr:succinate dehydrogenase, cytochrome b556 subunit [Steroidobacteraceae bacterium]